MKTLPLELRKNGFRYTQVLRGQRSCIYEQRVSENVRSFEVFLIKVKTEREFQGKIFPEHEYFPHNEAFGKWAWSCQTPDKAMIRFKQLESEGGGNYD